MTIQGEALDILMSSHVRNVFPRLRHYSGLVCLRIRLRADSGSSEPREGAIGAGAPSMVLQNTQNIPQIHTFWGVCPLSTQNFCAFGAILLPISAILCAAMSQVLRLRNKYGGQNSPLG